MKIQNTFLWGSIIGVTAKPTIRKTHAVSGGKRREFGDLLPTAFRKPTGFYPIQFPAEPPQN